jgi:hypothetical protein
VQRHDRDAGAQRAQDRHRNREGHHRFTTGPGRS